VQTLERAAALLRGAASLDGLSAILCELGFPAPALPLDVAARRALGFPPEIHAARIAQGTGFLRGIALELRPDSDLRHCLTNIGGALSRNAPQLLCIVAAGKPTTSELGIIAWSSVHSRPRIVSLVCNRDRLAASDAETLCALAAATGDADLLTHARWLDVLGRAAITRRFFTALQEVVAGLADSLRGGAPRPERDELALLYVSRLIFLSFLETRGWLNGDFGFLANG
jgi:hypothetical protein